MTHRPEPHGVHQGSAFGPAQPAGPRPAGVVAAFGADDPLAGRRRCSGLRSPRGRRSASACRSSPQGAGSRALPVREVGVGTAASGAHGRAIDGFLEALRQLHLGGLAAPLDDDLRRHVAPRNDDQLCHAGSLRVVDDGASAARLRSQIAIAREPVLEGEPEPLARRAPRSMQLRMLRPARGRPAGGNCRNTRRRARDGGRCRGLRSRAGRSAGRRKSVR